MLGGHDDQSDAATAAPTLPPKDADARSIRLGDGCRPRPPAEAAAGPG